MTRLIFTTCFALGLCLSNSQPVSAAGDEPQLRLVQSSAERLLEDLDPVMRLTSPKEQKKRKEIRDYLDLSFKGLQLDKLMRMDFIFGEGPIRYRPAVPLANEQVFWTKNLIPNGIQKQVRLGRGLYKLKGAFEGYMRIRDNYAIFGEVVEDLPRLAPSPEKGVEHLVDPTQMHWTKNAAMELVNTPTGITHRKKSYNDPQLGLRQELIQQVQKHDSETQNTFDLRKLSSEHMLDHIERMYVEAEYGRLLTHFNPDTATGRFELRLEPIAGTEFAKHVQQFNEKPLSFANIPKAPKSNMSVRGRLPLDDMLKRHAQETLELLRTIAYKDAEGNEGKTVDQKAATAEVIKMGFDLLLENVQAGMLDGFFESHANGDGTNTAIAAAKAVDGNAPLEILKKLDKTREGQKVEMEIEKVNGVAIHSFLIGDDKLAGFDDFFGSSKMYVGTSDDTIWLGAGPRAIEEMKAAIQEAAKPNTGNAEDPFVTVSGRIAPWLEFFKKSYPESGSVEFKKYRDMMIEAGQPGDDEFTMWANRDGEDLAGEWQGEQGWTRFLGKYMADMFE